MNKGNWKICRWSFAACILIALGIMLPLVFPIIFESRLNEKLVIAPNSKMLESFEKTPIPIYFEVYFFNITNPDEMYDGEKPILAQMGPYTYRQERYKHNIVWDHDKGTVSYNEEKRFFFEPDMSTGSEDDEVTTLNPVFATIGAKADELNFLIQSAMQLWTWQFEGFTLFLTKKVSQLTFDGYDDPVVAKLYEMTEKPKYASGKTGFLYPKNGSLDGTVEIYSGELGMENYQQMFKYKGEPKLSYWKTDACNMMNGTLGAQFTKPISKTEPLYMYSRDLCRSIYFTYERDTNLGPLTLYRYSLTKRVLDNSEENNCYCPDEFTCRASMVGISTCKDGAPIVMSTPHFYMGDDFDINMVEGLNPVKELHETFIEVEPNTGVTMRASKKIQVNIALKQYSAFSDFEYVQEVVLPILWVNEHVEVPMARAEALNEKLTGPKAMVGYVSLALIVVGVLAILALCCTYCFSRRKEMKVQQRQEMVDREANKNLLQGKNGERAKY